MQKHPKKGIYNFSRKEASGKYEKLSISEMKSNLTELIETTLRTYTWDCLWRDVIIGEQTIEHKFSDGTYCGKVISVVPWFLHWYNVQYTNDGII